MTIESNRGKLRIFLGYAAGVGKTTAMLKAAQQRLTNQFDVVIAHLNTHTFSQDDNLLRGLELIPPHTDSGEIDIDAVLARAPQIALVDDLAHSNAPGSRYSKRFQDVAEILDAGIDVYTTVSVQYIESLTDVVEQITGLQVKETIPDYIFDQADQIELIDILPEDLIQRFEEGKIEVVGQSASAVRKFYRPGNLTALRELAMRQVARHVDNQMRAYMQTRAIVGPWAAGERLLVCISSNPLSGRLVRAGCRLAQELHATWYVVYIDTPTQRSLRDEDQAHLNQTMSLAERLGAQSTIITGQSIADELIAFSRQNNITKIIIGQPLRSRWQEFLRGSVVNRLVRQGSNIDIYVISSGESVDTEIALAPQGSPFHLFGYVRALLLVGVATIAGRVVHTLSNLDPANLVMFYLIAVVMVALWNGYGPAIVAAIISVLAFNFFSTPPELTFHVAEAESILTFLGLLVAGVVIADLTSRARRQTETAQRREHETAQLYVLSRKLSATVDPDTIVRTVVQHTQQTFQCEVGVFLPEKGTLTARVLTPGFHFNSTEAKVAEWVYQHGQPAGRTTATLENANAQYIPLKTAQSTVGVLGFIVEEGLSLEAQRLMESFAAQSALAIEATQLAEKAQQAQLLHEKEKLQSALLNSISHDLRTPLVSITGTLSSLRDNDAFFDAETRRELLGNAYQEADRLNRLVGNLLDMSRLESGGLRLKRELYDLQEIIGIARAQLRERLNAHLIQIDLPDDLPLISIDPVLFAQVIVNLLENAAKYSDEQTPIEIQACHNQNQMEIIVSDQGPGIPESDIPHIFEKFFRASNIGGRGGSGLGLSICKGIVEAHGGTIRAENRRGGGTCFIIQLLV